MENYYGIRYYFDNLDRFDNDEVSYDYDEVSQEDWDSIADSIAEIDFNELTGSDSFHYSLDGVIQYSKKYDYSMKGTLKFEFGVLSLHKDEDETSVIEWDIGLDFTPELIWDVLDENRKPYSPKLENEFKEFHRKWLETGKLSRHPNE